MKTLKNKIEELKLENDLVTVIVDTKHLIKLGWIFDDIDTDNTVSMINVYGNGATTVELNTEKDYFSGISNGCSEDTGNDTATLEDLYYLEDNDLIIEIK